MKSYSLLKILPLFTILLLSFYHADAKYRISVEKLDRLFSKSENVSASYSYAFEEGLSASKAITNQSDENAPNYKMAAGIAIASSIMPVGIYFGWAFITAVTGGFGILLLPGAMILAGAIGSPWHRYYLGTDDNSFKIGALYCVTLNGLCWLTIADAVALLVADEGHQEYFNNSKFLMWIDEI